MKILVTGGAGFMGGHLVDTLVAAGHQVTVFDRNNANRADATCITGDLLNANDVQNAVSGHDVVYHLGGFADLNAARDKPMETATINVVGTLNVLEAMRRSNVKRFLFASTVYVYSRDGGFYRCSKQACENYIEEYARVFGLEYTVLRYGSLYGPRADQSNGVYRLLHAAITTGAVTYAGNASDAREYIHVEDAARLSVQAMEREFVGEHVLLTGAHALRAADLFTMFSEILGKDVQVSYGGHSGAGTGHYAVTPYAYTPKPGRKLVAHHYVDMGQGILRMVEEVSRGAR